MKNRTEYRLRKIVCAAAVCAMLSPAAAYAADQSDGGQTANAVRKEETVYIFTDATGKSTEVLVNDRLKNSSGEDVIEDVSTLSDIENVKGDETFSQEDQTLRWNAGGKDIDYQGTTQ